MLAGSAHYHGRFSDAAAVRARLLAEAADRVPRAPKTFLNWVGEDLPVVNEDAIRRGGGASYVSRAFQENNSSESYSILLLCGKPGPLAAHTPEICYANAEHSADANQRRWKPTPETEFTWQTFASKVEGQPNLEIAWAWCVDGDWNCPAVPRLAFGKEPFLYKLYIVRSCTRLDEPSAGMKKFVSDLIPTLQKTVFSSDLSSSHLDASNKQAATTSSTTSKPTSGAPKTTTGDRARD